MKRSRYCVKKGTAVKKKEDASLPKEELLDSGIKIIKVQNSTQKEIQKLSINKVPRKNKIELPSEPEMINESDSEEVSSVSDEPEPQKKKPEANKEVIKMAVALLKQVDPKKNLQKEKVIEILKEMKHEVNDLGQVSAIDYLLTTFENIEEELKDRKKYRRDQKKKLLEKTKRLDAKTFHHKINLDSDEKEPDENDRIFRSGKQLYSGSNQKYKTADQKKVKSALNKFKPKKDPKKLKQYNI